MREPILVIGLTLSNQAKVETHQSFAMMSSLTPIDYYARAAETSCNTMTKHVKSENI